MLANIFRNIKDSENIQKKLIESWKNQNYEDINLQRLKMKNGMGLTSWILLNSVYR